MCVIVPDVCVSRKSAPVLRKTVLSVGLIDLENEAEFFGIDRNPQIHDEADLALFHTKDPIKMNPKVGVISLPTKDNFGASSLCWIMGWGDVRKGSKFCTQRRMRTLRALRAVMAK